MMSHNFNIKYANHKLAQSLSTKGTFCQIIKQIAQLDGKPPKLATLTSTKAGVLNTDH